MGSHFFASNESLSADFALKLSTAAGVVIDIDVRGTTERADGICGDAVGFAFVWADWRYGLAVAEAVIFVPELPVPDERFDDGKFIREEFLVLWAVEFIMSPLFERDVFADEENKPADLFVLFLNDSK